MGRAIRGPRPGRRTTLIIAWGVLLIAAGAAAAQTRVGTAVVKTVTGQVEIQKKGDTQWTPAVVGARLSEGDNIRAHAGSSAVLDLPDGSTVFLAENSHLVVAN